MQTTTAEPRTVVRQVDKAVLYSDGTILLKDVRASYPHIFHPYKGKDSQVGKYGIVGLMPKTRAYFPAKDLVRERINAILKENKIPALKAENKFLRDGDLAGKEEYEDHYTINASEVKAPRARSNIRDPKTKRPAVLKAGEHDDVIYAGCWVNILIRPWWQNNEYGKKVNAGLVAVQFVRDDEAFGTGRISEEDVDATFDEFADEASGYDDDLGEDEGEL